MQSARRKVHASPAYAAVMRESFPSERGVFGSTHPGFTVTGIAGKRATLPGPFQLPVVPASFRFGHFAKIAECDGTISSADASKLTNCWFSTSAPDEVTARMLLSCQRIVDLIQPLSKPPVGLSAYKISTRDVDDLISGAKHEALRQHVEGWLQCPGGELNNLAELKKYKMNRKKRFNAMASRIGTYGGHLCDLIEFSVQDELKRFTLAWCYFSAELRAHGDIEIGKYQADFDILLAWATDYRTWNLEKQKLASSPNDPLVALRYMNAVPDVIKLFIFRVPGTLSPSSEMPVFRFADDEIAKFRTDSSSLGVNGAMASSQYRNTGFDIDRLRADYAELAQWKQEWHSWSREMVAEATARRLAVLHRFRYMTEVGPDVLVTYCRAPGRSCSCIDIEDDLDRARLQLERFIQQKAV